MPGRMKRSPVSSGILNPLSLLQYATWANESLGGTEGCLSKLKAADPNFSEYNL
uniref:Uncharacterized protein n=1 Tax=Otus sunia TaxID=257818 RepID=A0A8C8AI32_9STRI